MHWPARLSRSLLRLHRLGKSLYRLGRRIHRLLLPEAISRRGLLRILLRSRLNPRIELTTAAISRLDRARLWLKRRRGLGNGGLLRHLLLFRLERLPVTLELIHKGL